MYSIEFTQKASDQLSRLEEDLQVRIVKTLERIKIRPYHFIKRKEGSPYFIFRVGDYSAILELKNKKQIIYVLDIDNRGRIYK